MTDECTCDRCTGVKELTLAKSTPSVVSCEGPALDSLRYIRSTLGHMLEGYAMASKNTAINQQRLDAAKSAVLSIRDLVDYHLSKLGA